MNINDIIKHFFNNNKGYIIGYIIFMMAYPITTVMLPKYYGSIAQSIKDNTPPKFKLIILLLIMVNIMYFILNKMDSIFVPRLQAYVRTNIVQKILENYQNMWTEQETGSLISNIVKLPIIVRDILKAIRGDIIPIILIFGFMIFRFTYIDKRIGMVLLIAIVIGGAVFIPMFQKCINISTNMDNYNSKVHEKISELFDNMLDIYSMDTLDKEIDKLEKEQKILIEDYQKTFTEVNTLRVLFNGYWIVIFVYIIIFSYQIFKKKK